MEIFIDQFLRPHITPYGCVDYEQYSRSLLEQRVRQAAQIVSKSKLRALIGCEQKVA